MFRELLISDIRTNICSSVFFYFKSKIVFIEIVVKSLVLRNTQTNVRLNQNPIYWMRLSNFEKEDWAKIPSAQSKGGRHFQLVTFSSHFSFVCISIAIINFIVQCVRMECPLSSQRNLYEYDAVCVPLSMHCLSETIQVLSACSDPFKSIIATTQMKLSTKNIGTLSISVLFSFWWISEWMKMKQVTNTTKSSSAISTNRKRNVY